MTQARVIFLLLLFFVLLPDKQASATNSMVGMSGQETIVLGKPDSGILTITFQDSLGNTYVDSVTYGQFSTSASILSAFAGKLAKDYRMRGLCAHAIGNQMTLHFKGATSFIAVNISGPTSSFQWNTAASASYYPNPNLTSINPAYGPVGTTVTIFGTNLGTGLKLAISGIPLVYSSSSDRLIFSVPIGAQSGPVQVSDDQWTQSLPFQVTSPIQACHR